ncbi:hypothetical protein KL919_002766 [Ogataea angusta]|nr:hypothetical protein KL920_002135 [Ogataea angusta]KAG7834371.1 hypothetical protein KL943_002755 [Ogataea angusta]KAG7847882.1 hypothetical protein KL941_002061 [Ogataea angusta]KAG7860061.1 hypothetical protein KL919_002766 [Ogataea angusta]KAG7861716.1 hypothetical protein KL939_000737 [Ogataea angusta]
MGESEMSRKKIQKNNLRVDHGHAQVHEIFDSGRDFRGGARCAVADAVGGTAARAAPDGQPRQPAESVLLVDQQVRAAIQREADGHGQGRAAGAARGREPRRQADVRRDRPGARVWPVEIQQHERGHRRGEYGLLQGGVLEKGDGAEVCQADVQRGVRRDGAEAGADEGRVSAGERDDADAGEEQGAQGDRAHDPADRKHLEPQLPLSIIPAEIWKKPSSIDPEKEKAGIQKLIENGVQYADMESYHNMCRFNSGWFYRLEGLKKFKWYWRFEPNTDYYCSIDYDIFKFMEDNDKTYGFTISLYDDPLTVESLWPVTLDFVKKNPQYVHPNGAFRWLTDSVQNPEYTKLANGYSTCHFWSNFEIANMDFYRGEAYSRWFDALEAAGGFYYERWGDAPVHSVGVALFEDKSKIHWFRDIGYHHAPYKSIPNSDKCTAPEDSGYFAPEDVHRQNCLPNWIKYEMTHKELQQY